MRKPMAKGKKDKKNNMNLLMDHSGGSGTRMGENRSAIFCCGNDHEFENDSRHVCSTCLNLICARNESQEKPRHGEAKTSNEFDSKICCMPVLGVDH